MILNLPCDDQQLKANIVYWLLSESIIKKRSKSDNAKQNYSTFTQTHLFGDLNTLMNTSCSNLEPAPYLYGDNTLDKVYENLASQFRYGKVNNKKSKIYLFNNKKYVEEFDIQIRDNYLAAYAKAVDFSHKYFGLEESSKNDTLIQKLLYLIISDKSIDEAQEFYICSDGSTKTKADLRSLATIEFEAFLLGIWHFLIVSQRLQAKLKGIDNIIVDLGYKKQIIRLTYSDIEIAPTAALESETNPQTGSSDESETTDESEEQPEKETKAKKLTVIPNPEIAKKIRKAAEVHIASESDQPVDIFRDFNIISALANNDIRLSRGIFFYLLTNSIQTVHPKRNKNAVEKLFLNMLDLTVENSCSIDLSQSHVRDHHDKFRYLKELSVAGCLDDTTDIDAFSDKIPTCTWYLTTMKMAILRCLLY